VTGAFVLARPSVAASLDLECANPILGQGGDLAGERPAEAAANKSQVSFG